VKDVLADIHADDLGGDVLDSILGFMLLLLLNAASR
jgi:hypothetical protein